MAEGLFAMECIDGLPIDAACDRDGAPVETRLRRFLDVVKIEPNTRARRTMRINWTSSRLKGSWRLPRSVSKTCPAPGPTARGPGASREAGAQEDSMPCTDVARSC